MMTTPPHFVPRRPLGRPGFVATCLGAGDLADRSVPLERCAAVLRRALDAGMNLVDTAPAYEDGFSEEVVGAALRGRRESVFLVDKIDHLDRNEQDAAFAAAASFRPMSPAEQADTRRRAATAMDGKGAAWWSPPA